ncbi:MAG: SLBB domain-containing protein, partial [Alphaproteobacteria bacterium]
AGHVRVPGQRALAQATTLSRLVGDPNLFREDPYLLFAALETTDPQTRSRRLFPVNLHAVLDGRQDFTLRDGDRLIVLGNEDVAYLSSRDVLRTVATGGQPLKELERKLREEQQQQQQQLSGRLPTTGNPRADELAARQRLAQQRAALDASQQSSTTLGNVLISEGKIVTVDPATGEERELSEVLAEIIPCRGLEVLGSIAATTSPDRFRGVVRTIDPQDTIDSIARTRCPKIYDTYPDLLPLAVEHVIAVTGSVRRPGGYPVTPNTAVTAVIAVAGGLARDVDLTRVEISHVVPDSLKGVAADTRDLVDLATNGAEQVFVGPGDVLRFHAVFTDRDKGPVVLEGEFVRPGVYDIRRGERLSTVIARAGGVTQQAYPYGAVFTRERVKEAQERDFKRAARELNSALAAAASRGDIAVDALANLQLISAQIGSVEALGRVVTESDPTVLQVRPELDVVLEPGDRLFIPKRPSFVTVVGDVLNPGALQFISGTGADDYIRQAGGFQSSADESKVFVVYPNGVAEPLSVSVWNYNPVQIPPGSSIVVPKDPAPFGLLTFLQEGSSIVSQLAVTAASLAVISRR